MHLTRQTNKPMIRIAVVESDPLRFAGFSAVLGSEPDFDVFSASLVDFDFLRQADVVLLPNRTSKDFFDEVARLKESCPELGIIMTGSGAGEETLLAALASGAKGYVDESASQAELIQAIRIVDQGSVWAPRAVLSMFIDRARSLVARLTRADQSALTPRELEVLRMLVEGRSNKEIAVPLGIRERTVKAHMTKLMHKTGARNRIALSVYVISRSASLRRQDPEPPVVSPAAGDLK